MESQSCLKMGRGTGVLFVPRHFDIKWPLTLNKAMPKIVNRIPEAESAQDLYFLLS